GQTALVEELVRAGADVNAGSKTGFTALMFAAQRGEIGDAGDVDAARILVSAGAQVNAVGPNSKLEALIVASGIVPAKVGEMVLDNGADPNHVERIGYTALAWVVRDGTYGIDYANKDKVVDIVKLLLKHGADPNFRMMNPKSKTSTDISLTGATPLVLAAETNNTAAVKALMEAGADPKATTVQGTNAVMMAAGAATSVQRMRDPEERAMAIDTVKLLVEQGGVDPTAAGQYGWTALHAAAYQGL